MRTFLRFQISSFVSTIIDFSVTVLLTESLKILYITSSVIGFVAGGITNFIINKNWVFKTKDSKKAKQTLLYITIWIMSLIINTILVFLLTDLGEINFKCSKIIASILVGVIINYFAQKKIVFYVHQNKN